MLASALLVALSVCLFTDPGGVLASQVNVIRVEGVISPSSADYIVTAIKQAEKEKVAALVIELDTPGGLDTSMRTIIKEMLAAERPIVVYVAPSGARAASAGLGEQRPDLDGRGPQRGQATRRPRRFHPRHLLVAEGPHP